MYKKYDKKLWNQLTSGRNLSSIAGFHIDFELPVKSSRLAYENDFIKCEHCR